MKPAAFSLLLSAGLLAGAGAAAQGEFGFGDTPSLIGGVRAPVGFWGAWHPLGPVLGYTERVGDQFLAQAAVNDVPQPGNVQRFSNGFITARLLVLNDHAPGTTVNVQRAAWWAGWGADYATALTSSGGRGGFGLSKPVSVTLHERPNPPLAVLGFSLLAFTRGPGRLTPPPRAVA